MPKTKTVVVALDATKLKTFADQVKIVIQDYRTMDPETFGNAKISIEIRDRILANLELIGKV